MPTYPVATVDLAALKHNLKRVKQLAPNSKVMSVIKANGYGHGSLQVAQALADSDAFAVARLNEGIQLRQAGVEHDIVVLEGIHSIEQLQQAAELKLSPVIHHPSQLDYLKAAELTTPLAFCWLMIESGMHRLGFSAQASQQAFEQLSQSHNITGPVGLMSHFANADTKGDSRNQKQLETVYNVAQQLGNPQLNLANSAAVLSLQQSHQHWVRPGLMLYGISPFDDVSATELGLQAVMTLTAQIISIEQVKQGDQVGYGGDWQAPKSMRVGTVNIGYGDGYNRQLSNLGQVLVQGQKVDVLGRVSMDMICIDLSSLNEIEVGQEVILWGDKELTVEQVAKQAKTIAYEMVCQVSPRVKRNYING